LGKPVRHELFQNDARIAVNDGPLELAIIIPTFNESANIVRMVESLSLALAGIHWEAVFVDDNSPDGTADLVRSIAIENSNVRIVHRIGRRGLSTAVIEGMLATAAPILAVIDGDMQHDEAILPSLYAAVASGRAEIAVGTRYGEGGSVGDWDESRVLGSRIATKIGQLVLKVPLSDPMSGFFLLSRETLMRAVPRISGVGFKILLDIVSSLPQTPRIAEVPYTFRTRELGESKASALVAAEYLSLLADKTIGRFIPLRLLSFLAVGGIGVGVHLGILGALLAVGLAFLSAQIVAVMSAMSFNFFLNNIFTYHDRRLRGWRVLTGLISFYAVCSLGAVANIGIGAWANAQHSQWWVAGLAGVLIGAVWNFAASSFVTWRK
jgi:dolichol-phosphate mannosyltransferase